MSDIPDITPEPAAEKADHAVAGAAAGAAVPTTAPGSGAAPRCGPRPFYLVGHNPNSIARVLSVLDAGANAVEPDVNVYEHRPGELCIGEAGILDGKRGCDPDAPALIPFLDQLHEIARKRPELALVVFDCKPKTATPELGLTLWTAIRDHLTFDTGLNVIVSVSSRSHGAIFERIRQGLGPREGLMVDEDNDPIAVSHFFADVPNRCFGNGISFANSVLGPNVRPSMERACAFRAATGLMRFIYAWTVNDECLMREYVRIGVDGIITDNIAKLRSVPAEEEFRNRIRRATRSDNPFLPANFAYGLGVHTGHQQSAGTDADVTITLAGTAGEARIVLDASRHGRLEKDTWTWLTVPADDLGELQSVTVRRDDDGVDPTWYLDRITVESVRFGVSKQATFKRWIGAGGPISQPFD